MIFEIQSLKLEELNENVADCVFWFQTLNLIKIKKSCFRLINNGESFVKLKIITNSILYSLCHSLN